MLSTALWSVVFSIAFNQQDKPKTDYADVIKKSEVASLKGIDAIWPGLIFVLGGDKSDENLLSSTGLRDLVELKLRGNGIKIRGAKDYDTNDPASMRKFLKTHLLTLDVVYEILKINENSYCYYLTIQAKERAKILRTGEESEHVVWTRSTLGYAGSLRIKEAMKDTADTYMSEFANLYLTANPI